VSHTGFHIPGFAFALGAAGGHKAQPYNLSCGLQVHAVACIPVQAVQHIVQGMHHVLAVAVQQGECMGDGKVLELKNLQPQNQGTARGNKHCLQKPSNRN
jgi:hypothetical protein